MVATFFTHVVFLWLAVHVACVHSIACSLTHTCTLSLMHSLVHSCTCSLTRSKQCKAWNTVGVSGHVWAQVDAEALGLHDYHQVIRRPMDLGTIKKNLMAETAAYSSSAEVLKDVQQVWANCRNYNDEDDPIMYVTHTGSSTGNLSLRTAPHSRQAVSSALARLSVAQQLLQGSVANAWSGVLTATITCKQPQSSFSCCTACDELCEVSA